MNEKDIEAIRQVIREEVEPLLEEAKAANKKLSAIEKDMKAIKKELKASTEDRKNIRAFLDSMAFLMNMNDFLNDAYDEEFEDPIEIPLPKVKKPPIDMNRK